MNILAEHGKEKQTAVENLLLLCLLIVGGMELLLIVSGTMYGYLSYFLMRQFLPVPCVVFLIAAAKQLKLARKELLLSGVMVLWFIIIELHHKMNHMDMRPWAFFLALYLLAFPFAAITQDGIRQRGLKMLAAIYIMAAMVLVLYALLLIAGCVPAFLRDYLGWDGMRLNVIRHPNITACIFMIGIALSLGLCCYSQCWWVKCITGTAAVLMLMILPLTNCRTVVLITCFLCGGIIYVAICQRNRKLLGAVTAILVTVGLAVALFSIFNIHSTLFRLHMDIVQQPIFTGLEQSCEIQFADDITIIPVVSDNVSKENDMLPELTLLGGEIKTSEEPQAISGDNLQQSFWADLRTLNNRTNIWKDAGEVLIAHPEILLWGTDAPGAMLQRHDVEHLHNSWWEVLFRLGIPGLVMSLIFTGLAIRSSLILLRHNQTDVWKKTITLLVLCLLAAGFLEPYLFATLPDFHFIDFLFFLCLGYLLQWTKEVRRED